MDFKSTWDKQGISTDQQLLFLQAAGLDTLPDISALTDTQWNLLAGIMGEETVKTIRESVTTPPLSDTPLPYIPDFTPSDWSNILLMVAEIKAQLSNALSEASVEDIEAAKDRQKAANDKDAQKIQESIKKLKKALSSGLLNKIFGWIGAIIGLIAATVTAIAAGPAGIGLLAMAIMGVAMMAMEESGAMEKLMEAMVDNPVLACLLLGPIAGGILAGLKESGVISEEQFKMGFQIAMAACMIIASIASGAVVSFPDKVANIAKIAMAIANFVGSALGVASGASGIAQATYSWQSAQVQADMQENKAWLAKIQALLAEEMERLEQILQQINGEVGEVSDMIGDIAGSHSKIFNNMGA